MKTYAQNRVKPFHMIGNVYYIGNGDVLTRAAFTFGTRVVAGDILISTIKANM